MEASGLWGLYHYIEPIRSSMYKQLSLSLSLSRLHSKMFLVCIDPPLGPWAARLCTSKHDSRKVFFSPYLTYSIALIQEKLLFILNYIFIIGKRIPRSRAFATRSFTFINKNIWDPVMRVSW